MLFELRLIRKYKYPQNFINTIVLEIRWVLSSYKLQISQVCCIQSLIGINSIGISIYVKKSLILFKFKLMI